MRRISLDSLFTIVRSFLSHSTGTEYLPGHRRAGACGCVWAGVRGWAWAGGCMVLLLRRTTTRPNSPRSLCSRPLTPSVVGQLVQIAHKPHAVDGVGHAGVVAGEGPLPAGAAEGGVAWDSGHSRGGVSVRGAPRARAHAAAAARAPGLTNTHPECWSASGRVRCQVGAVTLRPITSSKPCARVGVHASVSLRAVEHARDAPPPPLTTHLHVEGCHAARGPGAGQGDVEVVAPGCGCVRACAWSGARVVRAELPSPLAPPARSPSGSNRPPGLMKSRQALGVRLNSPLVPNSASAVRAAPPPAWAAAAAAAAAIEAIGAGVGAPLTGTGTGTRRGRGVARRGARARRSGARAVVRRMWCCKRLASALHPTPDAAWRFGDVCAAWRVKCKRRGGRTRWVGLAHFMRGCSTPQPPEPARSAPPAAACRRTCRAASPARAGRPPPPERAPTAACAPCAACHGPDGRQHRPVCRVA